MFKKLKQYPKDDIDLKKFEKWKIKIMHLKI